MLGEAVGYLNAAVCQRVFHLPCPAPRRWLAGAPRASVCRRAWTGSPTGSPWHTAASLPTPPDLCRREVGETQKEGGGTKSKLRSNSSKNFKITKNKNKKTQNKKKISSEWISKEAWQTMCFWQAGSFKTWRCEMSANEKKDLWQQQVRGQQQGARRQQVAPLLGPWVACRLLRK